jgi:hypothetical protein
MKLGHPAALALTFMLTVLHDLMFMNAFPLVV